MKPKNHPAMEVIKLVFYLIVLLTVCYTVLSLPRGTEFNFKAWFVQFGMSRTNKPAAEAPKPIQQADSPTTSLDSAETRNSNPP